MKRLIWILLLSTASAQYVATIPANSGATSFPAKTFVNAQAGTGSNNDCTPTLSVTSGNTVVAFLVSSSTTGTLSVSDTNSNTYTATGPTPYAPASGTTRMQVWTTKISTTNATDAIDMHDTVNTNFLACAVIQFSGASATPVDQNVQASYGAVTTLTGGTTSTTATANEAIIGFFGSTLGGNPVFTAGSGYTFPTNGEGQGNGVRAQVIYQIVSATGTYTATGTETVAVTAGGGYTISIK